MKQISRVVLIATIFLAVSVCAQANIISSGYYASSETFVAVPEYSFMGGFDVMANGNYVINDGNSVREITQTGADAGTIYTFPTAVSASFVTLHNGTLYFADTSDGSSMIRSIPVTGGKATDITPMTWNYDLDFVGNKPYVVGGDTVYALNSDKSTTATASAAGYSGPHVFDASGNLYYAPSKFPFVTAIYEWSAAKVQAALLGDALGITDADAVIPVNGAAGMVFDKQGRLIFSDNYAGHPHIQRWDGKSITTLADFTLSDVTSPAITSLRYDAATDDLYAGINYYTSDGTNPYAFNYNYIAKLTVVPEPSSVLALCSLIGLAGSAKLLRRRSK